MTDTDTQYLQDTGEMMRLKVVNPPNAKFSTQGEMINGHIYNGHIGQRVYLGQMTDLPLYRPFRDEDGNHLRNPDGTLRYKKQNVPKWGQLVEIVPAPRGWQPLEAAPARPESAISKASGANKGGSQKSFGRKTARAADTSITE